MMNERQNCDDRGNDPKLWLEELASRTDAISPLEIKRCFEQIRDRKMQFENDIQNLIRGFFWTLFSRAEKQDGFQDESEDKDDIFPFFRTEIEMFTEYVDLLERKNMQKLKMIVREYMEDVLMYSKFPIFCKNVADLYEYLEHCLRICKIFRCATGTIIKEREVRNRLVEVLKCRFEQRELQKYKEIMGKFGLSLNYQSNRSKRSTRRESGDEEYENTVSRIIVRDFTKHNSGGGHWISAG